AALLGHIIAAARQMGLSRLSLETGAQPYFNPARELYRRNGFFECGPFGDYVPGPKSGFLKLGVRDDPGGIKFDTRFIAGPLRRTTATQTQRIAMRNLVLTVLAASLCGGAFAATGEKELASDMRALQGKWRVWLAENESIVLEIDRDTFTMTRHSAGGVVEPA